jgi:hypothetical protein
MGIWSGDIKNAVKLRKRFYEKQETTSLKLVALAKQENCTHIAYHRDEDNNGFEAMYHKIHTLRGRFISLISMS